MTNAYIVDDQIIEVSYDGEIAYDTWIEYQQLMLDELDKANHKLYILTNFTEVTVFDPRIAREAGTAKHLEHPNLGLIILVGGTVLMNFMLQVTVNRARKESKDNRLRIHQEYDRALEVIIRQRDIDNNM